MADMLAKESLVGLFFHEAQGCHGTLASPPSAAEAQDLVFRGLHAALTAPACGMSCVAKSMDPATGAASWATPVSKGRTFLVEKVPSGRRDDSSLEDCVRGKLNGFDIEAGHAIFGTGPPLSWDTHWPALLRLPKVAAAVYVRTNQVKHFVSKLHVDVLKGVCSGTHKVVSETSRRCYKAHKAAIDAPLVVEASKVIEGANQLGESWFQLLHKVARAKGEYPAILYLSGVVHSRAFP